MLRILADENVKGPLVAALRRRAPGLDLVTVQAVGLRSAKDREILVWAAREGRVVISHDVSTMRGFAWDRVRRGKAMPGLILVPDRRPLREVIDDLVLVATACHEDELREQVIYLPL